MKYMTNEEIEEGLAELSLTVGNLGRRSRSLAAKTAQLKKDLDALNEMGDALNKELEQMKAEQAQ